MAAFEMKTQKAAQHIMERKKKDEFVWEEIKKQSKNNNMERPLTTIEERKLKFFGHRISAGGLTKSIIQGKVEGKRKLGTPREIWTDNLKDWSGCDTKQLCHKTRNWKEWWQFIKP